MASPAALDTSSYTNAVTGVVVAVHGLSLLAPLRERIDECAAAIRAALGPSTHCTVHIDRQSSPARRGATTAVRIAVRAGGERISVYHEDPSVFSAVREAFERVLELADLPELGDQSGVHSIQEARRS